MTKTIGRGLVAALLVAAGCSSGGGNTTGNGGSGGSAGGHAGGTTGGAGTTGAAGTTGVAGTTGGAGTTGAAGTTGVAGTTGGAGTTGAAGTTGVAGTTGGAGTTGTGGTTGGGGTSGGGTSGGGAGGAGGGVAWLTLPANLPPTLYPPAGATLKIHDHATGAQVYTCTASSAGGTGGSAAGGAGGSGTTYSWVLKQPDAMLFDQSNTQVGTHGLGPNWTSTDGSIVNGVKVWQENSPDTTAIPWLLLRAASNTGTTGVFSDVTYVIRANTMLGKAPASGCDSTTAGMDMRVNYSADYFFFSGGASTTAWATPPTVPAAIAVPSGATLAIHDHAIGAQVYTCTASSAGGAGGGGGAGGAGGSGTTYSWVLKQPDAVLYDSTFTQVGTHGLGPNWTSTVDGSVVNGAKTAQASGETGAIPWLLLMATSTTGSGVFTPVTYVQRLATHGGVAPASGCDSTTAGTDTRIPYSADYYFFTGGNTDGGTNG